MKIGAFVFIFSLFFAVYYFNYSNKFIDKNIIAENGNLLYYNSPMSVYYNNKIYIGYLENSGKIYVKRYNMDMKFEKTYLVHNYAVITHKNNTDKTSDDHAAPALIVDENNELILATAYHGTDLFLYKLKNDQFKLFKQINGRFTYPNFIKHDNKTLLFVRHQNPWGKPYICDLVVLTSQNLFSSARDVITSNLEECVYASRPQIYKNNVYLSYSIHYYNKKYMDGWYIAELNLKTNKVATLNISNLIGENIGNTPTAIARKDNNIVVATSYFDKNEYYKQQSNNYTRSNTVKIIKLNLINNGGGEIKLADTTKIQIETVLEQKLKCPYYVTDVYIDDNLNYVFFDKDKLISNAYSCKLDNINKKYPIIFNNLLFFVKTSEPYSIRNFNTSLSFCKIK